MLMFFFEDVALNVVKNTVIDSKTDVNWSA